jgi:hypothetical protein
MKIVFNNYSENFEIPDICPGCGTDLHGKSVSKINIKVKGNKSKTPEESSKLSVKLCNRCEKKHFYAEKIKHTGITLIWIVPVCMIIALILLPLVIPNISIGEIFSSNILGLISGMFLLMAVLFGVLLIIIGEMLIKNLGFNYKFLDHNFIIDIKNNSFMQEFLRLNPEGTTMDTHEYNS